jgi:hypothetical protein
LKKFVEPDWGKLLYEFEVLDAFSEKEGLSVNGCLFSLIIRWVNREGGLTVV